MSKIKRDDKQLPVANKIDRGDEIAAACNPNANITTAAPKVAAFKLTNDDLRTAHLAKVAGDSEAQRLTGLETAADTAWNRDFESMLIGIEGDTGGDAGKIGTTTLVSYEPGKPDGSIAAHVLDKPENMHATSSDYDGTVDLACNRRKGAHGYVWQICTGDPNVAGNWKPLGSGSRSSYLAQSLTSGTTHWFRVAIQGSGSDNQSPWSDPVNKWRRNRQVCFTTEGRPIPGRPFHFDQ